MRLSTLELPNPESTYSVLLVGLGNIAFQYEAPQKHDGTDNHLVALPASDTSKVGVVHDTACIITHAQAVKAHKSAQLVAGVDLDSAKCHHFSECYDVPCYSSLDEALLQHKPDLAIVSASTSAHLAICQRLAKACVIQGVLCEKPIGQTVKEAQELLDIIADSKKCFFVNYIRCFEPKARRMIDSGRRKSWGKCLSGTIKYSGSLLNNGSHYLHLIMMMLGCPTRFRVDFRKMLNRNDFAIQCVIYWGDAAITLTPFDASVYEVSEFELYFEQQYLRYLQRGEKIEYYSANKDGRFSGNKTLSLARAEETYLNQYQKYSFQAFMDSIKHRYSGMEVKAAMDVIKLCEALAAASLSTSVPYV